MKRHSDSPAPMTSLLLRLGLAFLLGLASLGAHAYAGPAALKVKYGELRDQMRNNGFQRSLHIDSSRIRRRSQGRRVCRAGPSVRRRQQGR